MKSTRIIYWISTVLIVTFEGLLPALTFNSPLAKEGTTHLGYPDYFRVWLTLFKVLAILMVSWYCLRRINPGRRPQQAPAHSALAR